MASGGISVADLVVGIYSFLPLLLDFNFCILLFIVVKCTYVIVFIGFLCPILMIFRRPDRDIDLVLLMTICLHLDVNLLRIIIYRIIITRYFLNYIIPVDSLITINFTVLLTMEVCIMNAK